ncbi:t-SNARE [Kickxella alabastrina]|uniref:t-SNARE n=1 Tax=Kickxella alabastrina TaxID=61397 RepID=UPI00221FF9C3|nr:t-SNARE [Kickxella alabastrina]KAI7820083.1 t-SNARE [Kickxella alabastrina]
MARDRLNALGNEGWSGDQKWQEQPDEDHTAIPMNQLNRSAGGDNGRYKGGRGRSTSSPRRANNQGYGQGYDQGYDQRGYNNTSTSSSPDDDFFNMVDSITGQMADLDNIIKDISGLQNGLLSMVGGSTQHMEQTERLQREEKEAKRMVVDIKQCLSSLDVVIQRARDDPSVSSSQAVARSSRQQALTKRFADQISRYRQMEYDSSKRQRVQLERQYKIVRPDATEEEVRDAVDNENANQVFSQAVINTNRANKAREVLKDVESRRQQIRNIEQSISQLAEMFVEVNEMVNQQQQKFDNIEAAVEDAHVNIDKGNVETKQAIVHTKSSRKLKWWILFIVIIILVIIAVVLYFKLKK